jgi:hypothetical protein
MPTTSLGIEYPCETDVVSPSDFSAYALSVEAALVPTFAQTVPLLRRDYVSTFAQLPTVAVNVTTTISWNTPPAINNPNGMFNPASPTLFTLSSSGSYLVTLNVSTLGSVTTGTSLRGAILLNGVEQIWAKWPGDGTNTLPLFVISGHLVAATAGQTVTATELWTGTGGPDTPSYQIRICKISDL